MLCRFWTHNVLLWVMPEALLCMFKGMGLLDQGIEGGYLSPYFSYHLSKIHKANLLWLCNTSYLSSFLPLWISFYTLINKMQKCSIAINLLLLNLHSSTRCWQHLSQNDMKNRCHYDYKMRVTLLSLQTHSLTITDNLQLSLQYETVCWAKYIASAAIQSGDRMARYSNRLWTGQPRFVFQQSKILLFSTVYILSLRPIKPPIHWVLLQG